MARAPILPRPVTRRDVERFTDQCVILRATWLHYRGLFEGSDLKRELLQQTAPVFFGDLNALLIENLILRICKLTDKELTMGKRNLTVLFLINNVDFSAEPATFDRLRQLADKIGKFRDLIEPARTKRIAHLDLDMAHQRKSLGRAPVEKWSQFWLDLQEFVAILHKRYVSKRGSFQLNGISYMSDAENVVRALKEGTYFREVLHEKILTRAVAAIAENSKYHDV